MLVATHRMGRQGMPPQFLHSRMSTFSPLLVLQNKWVMPEPDAGLLCVVHTICHLCQNEVVSLTLGSSAIPVLGHYS